MSDPNPNGKPCGCTAILNPTDHRAEIWQYAYGTLTFPIRLDRAGIGYNPLTFDNPNFPSKKFLYGDARQITKEQLQRLGEIISKKFGVPVGEVLKDAKDGIIPILYENITIHFCPKHLNNHDGGISMRMFF